MAQQTLAAPAVEQRIPMTYEEWLAWPDGESRQSEWVDGEAIIFMPPKTPHLLIGFLLERLVGDFVDVFDLGRVGHAPFEVRLPTLSREPDVFFVKTENLDRWTPERIIGPVDLAIELTSNDSVTRDRRDKFRDYAEAGVLEYWLVDSRPDRHQADFYALGPNRTYEPIPLDADGRFHSRVLPGFWLRPEWLRQDPLPNPLACLLEIAPDALAPLVPRAASTPQENGQNR